MFKRTNVVAVLCVAVGTALGYGAASGMLNPFRQRGEAAPPSPAPQPP
jgi:hypothetical protein